MTPEQQWPYVETPQSSALGVRLEVLGLCDVAAHEQRVQHLVPAGERLPRAVERVVVGGRLRQPGEERGLPEAELPRREREVRLGGRLDAVGVVAVVDLV